jgi:hypothetical protein
MELLVNEKTETTLDPLLWSGRAITYSPPPTPHQRGRALPNGRQIES